MSLQSVGRSIFVAALFSAAIATARGDDPSVESLRPIRVRVEWGCTTARVWNGLLEVNHGRFEQPASLGVEADEPGTIWIEGGAVWFQRRSPRIYDGFDVTVLAPIDATLNLTLQAAGNEAIREQFAINVSEIRTRPKSVRSEQENLRLIVRRTPGDNLPVRIERPHLIFRPQEHFHASVDVPLPWKPNADTQLTWQLCAARSERVLSRQSIAVDFEQNASAAKAVPLDVPLPGNEGAYDICLIESANGRESNRRTVQVLVLDESSPRQSGANIDETSAELVDSFRPGNVHLFRHLTPKTNRKAIGDAVSNLFSFMPIPHAGETDIEVEPSEKVQWDAYKLRVRHPGRPHRLTVFANASHTQNLGISLLEPNAAGQLMPVGLDSGVFVRGADSTRSSAESSVAAVPHDLIIWPKVKEPILLFHDMGSGTPLNVERVEVHEFESLPRSSSIAPMTAAGARRRLVGPAMQVPMLPESFGAEEGFDSESGRSLDDWTTFHAAATRAADYLHYAGYNSLMLAAFADGSTIYPSALLQPTPRYDTGVFFSSGQDPQRKDVLELMFRVFDREGLTLVPLAQFATPLPALERAITDDANRAVGIELIGRDGRTWREARSATRGLAAYYNPLNPQVQQAILDVVAELATRYRSHQSFAGLAVELGSPGYLQLPGLEWGLDDDTIARFEKSCGVRLPGGDDRDRFQKRYDLLTTKFASQWNRWRCEELSRFHRRLADTVAAQKPEARLILAAKDLFAGDNNDVDEAVRSGQKLDQLLSAKGIDFNLYKDASSITVLRPGQWRAPDRPLAMAVDDAMSYGPNVNTLFANCTQGSLFYHHARECRIGSFDEVSPWQPAYTWVAAQASVAGVENRRRYAMSLAAGNAQMVFDGGWLLPMGQEHATRHLREVIAQLPAVAFHLSQQQHQPVSVRMARHEGTTWIYVVNEVPHPVDVRLDLSCAPGTECRVLPTDQPHSLTPREAAGSTTKFQLDSFDVWACRLVGANVDISAVDAVLPDNSKSGLAARVKSLDQRISLLRNDSPAEKPVVVNPGFEEHSEVAGELPGWEPSVQNAAQWQLDENNPRSGNSSLLLTSAGDNLAALSSPLSVDDSRLLTLLVWLRSDQDAADVRLVFSADVAGHPHTRFVPVRVDKEWRHYVFRVTDIPSEKLDSATVRIEMRGQGKLWIDDVDIRRNRLSPEELRQLTKIASAVNIAWDEGRYADCERLLDGYWGQLPFDDPQPTRNPKAEPSRTAEGLRKLFRR